MQNVSQLISVGIPTAGVPDLQPGPEGDTLLRNMLIGLDFHWQKCLEVRLPGEIIQTDDPVYSIINKLPVETYLECVVGSEMNPDAPVEFLKAHAVISRSWAIGKIRGVHSKDSTGKVNDEFHIIDWQDTDDHQGFDVCSDDHCQRYQGVQNMDSRVLEAIRGTAGEIIVSEKGQLVDARFSKCCGGRTEIFSSCWQPREEPCIESISDPWCDLSSMDEYNRLKVLRSILKEYDLANEGGFSWRFEISADDIAHNLQKKFKHNIGKIEGMSLLERGPSGRAIKLLLKGSEGELVIGKELMIRRLLSQTHLYSSWIDIRKNLSGTGYLLSGHGWGHGVGLCQIGAARMALEGYTYDQILSFYYPGSRISIM